MEKKIDKDKIQELASNHNSQVAQKKNMKIHLHIIIILLAFLLLLYKRPDIFTNILYKINPNLGIATAEANAKNEVANATDEIPSNVWVGDEIKFGNIDFIVYDIKPSLARKSAFLVTKEPMSSPITTFIDDYFTKKQKESFEKISSDLDDKVIFFTKEMQEMYKDVFKGNPLNLTGDNKHFAVRVRYNSQS